MRGSILLLLIVMFALIVNIITYSVSEDYRFFVKKIKYKEDVIYENTQNIDDSKVIEVVETWEQWEILIEEEKDKNIVVEQEEWFTFLDAIGGVKEIFDDEPELPELSEAENYILDQLKERFVLSENTQSASLFDITTEYPDEYYEYGNKHVSLYMFSTKSYSEVLNIFKVLAYELPYILNETNNFWKKSFYINLEGVYADEKVRLVFAYQNKAFWLKIKKDSYNTVKEILDELRAQK